ncbi:MAG: hypothetical protein Kow0010_25340 [Dehalococcoidia bacterium]
MTRITFRRACAGLAALAGLAVLAGFGLWQSVAPSASAQGLPPDTPKVFYGSISGASVNSGVVAVVVGPDGRGITCGAGVVLSSGGSTVYAVQVITDSQKAGCGASGRTVHFYLTPASPGAGGKMANETATWPTGETQQRNLTPGSTLIPLKGWAPMLARDGVQF